MSKLKTVWDAINELKGDLNNTYLLDINNDVYLFHCIIDGDYVCSPFETDDTNEYICTQKEFNALVEEMTLGLDVNSVTHGDLYDYVSADKTILEKETKPDYTSLEFWKDAPDGKDYLITYKSGVVANVLNFFSSEPKVIDGYYRIKEESVGYGQSSWELFKRPQSTPTEKSGSIINKPFTYKKEFKVRGGTNIDAVYQPCRVVYSGTKYTVLVNANGREFSRKTAKLDIRDIDTRTKKEKAIEELIKRIGSHANNEYTRDLLSSTYDEWVGE